MKHVYLLCRVCGAIEVVTLPVYLLWISADVKHCGVQQKRFEPETDGETKKIPAQVVSEQKLY